MKMSMVIGKLSNGLKIDWLQCSDSMQSCSELIWLRIECSSRATHGKEKTRHISLFLQAEHETTHKSYYDENGHDYDAQE